MLEMEMESLGVCFNMHMLSFGSLIKLLWSLTQLAEDYMTDPVLDYAAAIWWSKMVSEQAGPESVEAIEWCLHAKQVSDGSWKREIWTHVILFLDAYHRQVLQKSSSTWFMSFNVGGCGTGKAYFLDRNRLHYPLDQYRPVSKAGVASNVPGLPS